MAKFSDYPAAVTADYANASTFLMQNSDGDTVKGDLETLKSTFFCNILCTSITVATADVLNLSGTPVEVVAAAGAGTTIEVVSAFVKLDFNAAAYTGSPTLRLSTTIGQAQMNCTILDATQTTTRKFIPVDQTTVGYVVMAENAALQLDAAGAVATGDSDIEVWVVYRVVNV